LFIESPGALQGRNEDRAADLDAGDGSIRRDGRRSPDLLEVLMGDFWDRFGSGYPLVMSK